VLIGRSGRLRALPGVASKPITRFYRDGSEVSVPTSSGMTFLRIVIPL
jgi:hypothetical protein